LFSVTLAALMLLIGLYADQLVGQEPEPQLYLPGVPMDATLLRLDKAALDEAYQQQVVKLFIVWLSQGAGDPNNINAGLANARRAYTRAAQQIARREQQLLLLDQRARDLLTPPTPATPAP